MPETLPTPAIPGEHRPRRHAPPCASEAEVLALVERAARVPDGLAVLEGAPLECVAVLLGVAPGVVERARAALTDPAVRAAATRHHLRLTAGRRASSGAAAPPRPAAPPRDPQSLLLVALARAGGVDVLLGAAPEAAAVAFGVHPELVLRTREAAGPLPPHA